MLERIRKALASSGEPKGAQRSGVISAPLGDVMPRIAAPELAANFQAELEAVGGKFHHASTAAELDEVLRSICASARARAAVLSRNPLLDELKIAARLESLEIKVTAWEAPQSDAARAAYRAECFAADIGVTGVDFALAETGSLIVTSHAEGSQLASLAPPVHLALFRRAQLRASLDEVLAGLYAPASAGDSPEGRSMVFVTGTSRTADIEQQLVRGVHGPREMYVILTEDDLQISAG